MKYHRIEIVTDKSIETYNKITNLLGVYPLEFENNEDKEDKYWIWTYSVDVEDEAPNYDFINKFLDILETKFDDLEKIGVTKDNITFWLLYNYEHQCSMEFHPQEMKRLGETGIVLCIDCWEQNDKH